MLSKAYRCWEDPSDPRLWRDVFGAAFGACPEGHPTTVRGGGFWESRPKLVQTMPSVTGEADTQRGNE